MRLRSPFARSGAKLVIANVAPPKRQGDDTPKGGLQPWQKLAWGYYKTLGEIHYGGSFYARMLSGVELMVQERSANGEWKKTEKPAYVEQLQRLENARGGTAAIQGSYGRLTFVQGESMLCRTLESLGEKPDGQPIIGKDGNPWREVWEMLSSVELSYDKDSKTYTRKRAPGAQPEKITETDPDDEQPDTMIAYRFYHRDPEFSGMADSSMRAVLEDCEELLLLKRSIRNTARNRGAGNGILILPNSMGGDEIDQGDGTKIPKNAKAIYDALTAPIADETASHAVTPIILFAPNDVTAQTAFHIDLRGSALYRETGLRDECIRRIAIGLDMPPEALLGTSGANHWTAWQISDAAWTNHGDPIAREFCEQLTSALIAPVALEEGADPQDVRVWYDAAEVVQDPDRGRAAADAHDRLAISDECYRRETGFEENDAPDDAEWKRRAEIKKKPSSSSAGDSEPAQGQASAERIIGMAEACLLRCRELAGSRLRTRMEKATSPANLRARIKGEHNGRVASILAPELQAEADADALVAGAGSVLLTGLRGLDLDPNLSSALVRMIEEHAARTLWLDQPGDLPDEVLMLCALTSRRI